MYTPLPEEYIIQQFKVYAGYAKRAHNGIYTGGCPSCREGKSWGHKRRLFYIPEYDNIHCKNCNKSWNPRAWIMEVSGMSYREINEEAKDYEYIPIEILDKKSHTEHVIATPLPLDSINLNDKHQLEFYKNNKIVRECIKFIMKRRLNTAINKPTSLYISLKDYIHKNRLCIPFENSNGEIAFYQSRSFLNNPTDTLPKYLGRVGADKILFGENNISEDLDYIFIFEGPIDAMFVRNGVAIGGVDINKKQQDILNTYAFHKKIWVLDNQNIDTASMEASKKLLDEGETVFIWPKGLEEFKDFNDICVYKKINELSSKFILDNSFTGLKGKLKLKQ